MIEHHARTAERNDERKLLCGLSMVRPILRMLQYPSQGSEMKQALRARIVSEGMKRGCPEHLGPRRLSRLSRTFTALFSSAILVVVS